jgi:DNA topoisomerase-1
MSKKYSTTTTLVIVESPAKCKKIEEYLGPGYKCVASYGHLRELPSLKNIDIENNFAPTYTIIDNAIKKKQISFLKKEIENAHEVILASDDDREGEKISYCVAQIFNLDINKTKRITFNEITEQAIQHAIKNPRTIDMDLVHAQQARQILDMLVGFKVTPMLWKFINKNKDNSLSAGRCQTPALKLIYDNEQDVKQCEERKVYNVTGIFTNSNITFDLSPQNKYETEEDLTDFLYGSADFPHVYTCSKPSKTLKKQPEPFTTSTLQQTSSNELHYAPKETMRICQALYEAGYITYMRTDSKTYSKEFIDSTKEYIVRNYDAKYINDSIDSLASGLEEVKVEEKKVLSEAKKGKKGKKVKNVEKPLTQINDSLRQNAHEAIRPTNISLFELPEKIDSKERRMYKLIWENTLESCMATASFFSITANIAAFQNTKFTYASELIDFPGWKIVSKKYANEIKLENKEYQYLQQLKQNTMIPYKKMFAKVTIKGSKLHYTEARLVQLLEERGIGRPSTFSSLVDKIQERGYVKKEDVKGKEIVCKDYELSNGEIYEIENKREFGNEKGKLVIQPLGTIVMEFLDKHFSELFNYSYTKDMEDELDKIAKGQALWYNLCDTCNKQLDILVDGLKDETKIEVKLDEHNTYLVGKYGPVIKCVEEINGKEQINFRPIKKGVDIHKIENGDYNQSIEEIIDTNVAKKKYVLGQYEEKDVVLQKGKFGLYMTWGENSKALKELGNRPIENITFDEIKKYLEEGSNLIREINASISIRKGVKGEYIFYKTAKMKKPQFFDLKPFQNDTKADYKTCNITVLKSWLKEKYDII